MVVCFNNELWNTSRHPCNVTTTSLNQPHHLEELFVDCEGHDEVKNFQKQTKKHDRDLLFKPCPVLLINYNSRRPLAKHQDIHLSTMKSWLSNKLRPENNVNTAATPNNNSLVNRSFVNGVYYPNWKVYNGQAPSSLTADCITHVFYAFAW